MMPHKQSDKAVPEKDGFVISAPYMPRIHYFNPGHETAILLNRPNYTAPANVRKMQRDLALLPLWYAETGDWVYAGEEMPEGALEGIPQELLPKSVPVTAKELSSQMRDRTLTAAPWGLSPQSIHLFERLREQTKAKFSIPSWKEEYSRLTGRQTAAGCLERIRLLLPDLSLPATPRFCRTIEEIEQYMTTHEAPFVLKTPYSSSGRGILWVRKGVLDRQTTNWILGSIAKQGEISVEQGLDKVQDFAMEFYSDGQGLLSYEGLSLFDTEERGAYAGNRLDAPERMRADICRYTGEAIYERVKEAVRLAVQEVYAEIYTGYIGVDMMIYRRADGRFAIHPCVEINMRYTMGMVALRLYHHLIAPRSSGYYRVSFDKEPQAALKHHQALRETYPLRIEEGRIKSGYLSLCPVNSTTHYRAYLLIN